MKHFGMLIVLPEVVLEEVNVDCVDELVVVTVCAATEKCVCACAVLYPDFDADTKAVYWPEAAFSGSVNESK